MTIDEKSTANVETDGGDPENQENFDHDAYWKDLIERFFYELLKRAVPELYEKANTAIKPKYLSQEFRDILNMGKRDKHKRARIVDVVAEVPLKDGKSACVLLHCEIQKGSGGGNFAERMFRYMCLIYAHHRKNPVAVAIIVGARRTKERFYVHSHFGTKVNYEYNNVVLAEIDDDELKTSDNPVDLALYAAKCALRAKEEHQKLNYLRTLLGLLSERGWSEDDKRDLLLFLERIIDLQDEALEKEYVEYRTQLKKEGKIMYIPLGERELARELRAEGMAQGMAQGMTQGKEEIARNLLARGDYSAEVISEIAGLPVERIYSLRS